MVLATVLVHFSRVLGGVLGQFVNCPKNTRFWLKNKNHCFKGRRGGNFMVAYALTWSRGVFLV